MAVQDQIRMRLRDDCNASVVVDHLNQDAYPAAFPAILKVTGMVEMLVGRLEIFPVLYLFRSIKNG